MSQNPSMSLFLNSKSAVINTMANIDSLPFTVSRNRNQQGIWQQHGPQTSTWSLVPTCAMDLSMVSGGTADHRHHVALCCCSGHGHQQGFRLQHRPWACKLPSVATRTMDIITAPASSKTTDPDMTPSGGNTAQGH